MVTRMTTSKDSWRKQLQIDPVPRLLASQNQAIIYFVRRDLLNKKVEPIAAIQKLPGPKSLLNKQQVDGAWRYPGVSKEHLRSQEDYNQVETYRNLSILIEKYGFDGGHSAIVKAAEFLLSKQTAEGDFRGIYGNQYSPNYSAAIMELLIKAGYDNDPRIEKGFKWLLSIRQNDGGWAIALRTVKAKYNSATLSGAIIQSDLSKPFSHLVTGVVLRAFAASVKHRKSEDAFKAGKLLASRLFKRDVYPDRNTPEYWERVSYPFWFTDIVSALDSLSLLGFTRDNPNIARALNWLKQRQRDDGIFEFKVVRGKDKDSILWITLAVCRTLKRFYS